MADPVLEKDPQDMTDEERQAHQRAVDRGDIVDGVDDGKNALQDGKDADGAPLVEEEDDKLDPDAVAAVAGEGDEPGPVPYSRFREVNEQLQLEREARARAEGVASVTTKAAPTEADPLAGMTVEQLREKAFETLMVEGDTKAAARIMARADHQLRTEVVTETTTTIEGKHALVEMNAVANKMVKDYPFLAFDDKHPEKYPNANKQAIQEVIDMRDMKIQQGIRPADALAYAVDLVGKLHAKTAPATTATTTTAAPDKPTPGEVRQAAALARAAAAAVSQPAILSGGKGTRTANADGPLTEQQIRDMPEAQFKQIPDDVKRRERGDFPT